jgi:transposase
MDMAGTMKNIVRNVFTHAIQTVDRFHVMKNVLEDMSALITKHKTDIKKAYLEEQDRAKIERRQPKHQKYGNSETLLELITRGRYQLLQRRSDWNTTQHMRWDCFVLIPELQNITAMYQQIEKVFEIYDDKESTRNTAQTAFHTWFQSISKLDFITELQNTGRMIKHHLERILNYFHSRLTNGYAE